MNTTYESPIGRAIALLRAGRDLPFSLVATLREEGIDIPSFITAHRNKFN